VSTLTEKKLCLLSAVGDPVVLGEDGTGPVLPLVEVRAGSSYVIRSAREMEAEANPTAAADRGDVVHVLGDAATFRSGTRLGVAGRDILVVRDGGSWHALDAVCYHTGGPLNLGDIESIGEEGTRCIVCPWHRYPIDIRTGESYLIQGGGVAPTSKGVKQRVHEVFVRPDDGALCVRLREGGEEVSSDAYATMGLYKTQDEVQRPGAKVHSGLGRVGRGSVPVQAPTEGEEAGADAAMEEEQPWLEGRLVLRKHHTPTSFLLRYEVPGLGRVPPGLHVQLRAGDGVVREYTPIRAGPTADSLDFVVRRYETPGALSATLTAAPTGSTVGVRGPRGRWTPERLDRVDHLILIANGTGLTPLFSLLEDAVAEGLRVSLLLQSARAAEVLLADDLDQLTAAFPSTLSVHHVLSRPDPGTQLAHTRGRLDERLLLDWLTARGAPPRCPDRLALLLCGTDSFVATVRTSLHHAGYGARDVFVF
jgi:ferredoxin-NADP reductase/nitrite reductase/ring-hydroxylating ferredoxin subunit